MLGLCLVAAVPGAGAFADDDDPLDATFGTAGRVSIAFDGSAIALAVGVDSVGRVVTAGSFVPAGDSFEHTEWAIARMLAGGQLDPAFDGDGMRSDSTYRCSGDGCPIYGPIRALAFGAGDKFVAGGDEGDVFLVARYAANGALDASFGDGGFASGPYSTTRVTTVRGLAAGPSDATLALVSSRARSDAGDERYGILRLDPAGAPDAGFGDGGWHNEAFAPAVARAIARQSNGRILVAGYHDYGDSPGSNARCLVARYWANGAARDDTFGDNGMVQFHFDQPGMFDTCIAMAIQPDGRIVLAGTSNERLAIARLLADGTPDTTFHDDGRLVVAPPDAQSSYAAYGVAVDAFGRVLFAGSHWTALGTARFLVGRLLPDGALDAGFGTDGLVETVFGAAPRNEAIALALTSDGRPIAAGGEQPGQQARMALARYLNPGVTPTPSPSPTATASPSLVPTPTPTPSRAPEVRGRVVLERRASSAGAEACIGLVCTTTAEDGTFALTALVGGLVTIQHNSYLATERRLPAVIAGDVLLPPVTLVAGDLNQDGRVEVDDAAMVGQRFDLVFDPARPGPPWLDGVDITDDGRIDIRDMVGVQFNLLKTAPTAWP